MGTYFVSFSYPAFLLKIFLPKLRTVIIGNYYQRVQNFRLDPFHMSFCLNLKLICTIANPSAESNVWLNPRLLFFLLSKTLNSSYMNHTFDSGGFFTFLVALAHGATPNSTALIYKSFFESTEKVSFIEKSNAIIIFFFELHLLLVVLRHQISKWIVRV